MDNVFISLLDQNSSAIKKYRASNTFFIKILLIELTEKLS